MTAKADERKTVTKGLHYHVSDLSNVDPLGLRSASCDVGQKNTVADYMTSIERRPYENQNLCRKNGIRVHRNKINVGGEKRLKRPAPPPPVAKKTLKDMAQEYFTTLDTDYVVTNLKSVTVGTTDPTESFVQLTTEPPNAPNVDDDEHMYDTISGHYKKKGANNGDEKQDAYYLDIIDDYSKPAFPTSSCSYDEIKCKTLSLSRHKNMPRNVYSSTNWEFLNRTKQLMVTELLAKLPATRNRRLLTIFVAAVLLLFSIWLVSAATKPNNTHGLIFPTQTHQLIGGTVFRPGVTIPAPTTSPPVPRSDCIQNCRDKIRTVSVCASNWITYESKCYFKVAQCKNPSLFKLSDGSCSLYRSDEMEDD